MDYNANSTSESINKDIKYATFVGYLKGILLKYGLQDKMRWEKKEF